MDRHHGQLYGLCSSMSRQNLLKLPNSCQAGTNWRAFQSLRSFQHLPTRHLVKGRKVSFMMAAAEAARWWSFGESHNGCCFS